MPYCTRTKQEVLVPLTAIRQDADILQSAHTPALLWRLSVASMGRRSAAVMCLMGALLCAMLGTGHIGGAEASLVHGGTRGGGLFGRHRASSTSSYFRSLRRMASVAVGRNLALFALWPTSGAPPFAALAASHLRVDPSTGLIEELPESEIAEDMVAFHTPVQHPGGQRPGRCELVSSDFFFLLYLSTALEFIYIFHSFQSRVFPSRMTASMRAVRCVAFILVRRQWPGKLSSPPPRRVCEHGIGVLLSPRVCRPGRGRVQ